jgi:hypothetical protein
MQISIVCHLYSIDTDRLVYQSKRLILVALHDNSTLINSQRLVHRLYSFERFNRQLSVEIYSTISYFLFTLDRRQPQKRTLIDNI